MSPFLRRRREPERTGYERLRRSLSDRGLSWTEVALPRVVHPERFHRAPTPPSRSIEVTAPGSPGVVRARLAERAGERGLERVLGTSVEGNGWHDQRGASVEVGPEWLADDVAHRIASGRTDSTGASNATLARFLLALESAGLAHLPGDPGAVRALRDDLHARGYGLLELLVLESCLHLDGRDEERYASSAVLLSDLASGAPDEWVLRRRR